MSIMSLSEQGLHTSVKILSRKRRIGHLNQQKSNRGTHEKSQFKSFLASHLKVYSENYQTRIFSHKGSFYLFLGGKRGEGDTC